MRHLFHVFEGAATCCSTWASIPPRRAPVSSAIFTLSEGFYPDWQGNGMAAGAWMQLSQLQARSTLHSAGTSAGRRLLKAWLG